MDGVKRFYFWEKLTGNFNTNKIFSQDTGMEFGTKKCAMMVRIKGKTNNRTAQPGKETRKASNGRVIKNSMKQRKREKKRKRSERSI